MSQENVEIVRAIFDTWNAADMDAFHELYDPDVIVRTADGWPEPGPYVGREAARRFHQQLRDTWDANTAEPISDFIDAGDRVAVRYIWRGAGHGPDLNMEVTLVFTMRKGRIVFEEFFWDHAEALEALGVSEQAMSEGNVAVITRAGEAWNRQDFDEFLRFFDPEVEFRPGLLPPGEGTEYRGHEGMRQWIRNQTDPWVKVTVDPQEQFEVGEDRVLVIDRWHFHGRQGIEIEEELPTLVTFRDGVIVRVDGFTDKAEAFEAAGLSG